jgi:hypothetical protein
MKMQSFRDTGRLEDTLTEDAEVVEVALLLPARDVVAMEVAARRHGLTPGQLIRRLIHDFLSSAAQQPPLQRAELEQDPRPVRSLPRPF